VEGATDGVQGRCICPSGPRTAPPEELEKTFEKIVESAAAVVGCDYAGVLLTSKGNKSNAITGSHSIAEKADKLQAELGEGPGIAATSPMRVLPW
jgi:hypothetical protein